MNIAEIYQYPDKTPLWEVRGRITAVDAVKAASNGRVFQEITIADDTGSIKCRCWAMEPFSNNDIGQVIQARAKRGPGGQPQYGPIVDVFTKGEQSWTYVRLNKVFRSSLGLPRLQPAYPGGAPVAPPINPPPGYGPGQTPPVYPAAAPLASSRAPDQGYGKPSAPLPPAPPQPARPPAPPMPVPNLTPPRQPAPKVPVNLITRRVALARQVAGRDEVLALALYLHADPTELEAFAAPLAPQPIGRGVDQSRQNMREADSAPPVKAPVSPPIAPPEPVSGQGEDPQAEDLGPSEEAGDGPEAGGWLA